MGIPKRVLGSRDNSPRKKWTWGRKIEISKTNFNIHINAYSVQRAEGDNKFGPGFIPKKRDSGQAYSIFFYAILSRVSDQSLGATRWIPSIDPMKKKFAAWTFSTATERDKALTPLRASG